MCAREKDVDPVVHLQFAGDLLESCADRRTVRHTHTSHTHTHTQSRARVCTCIRAEECAVRHIHNVFPIFSTTNSTHYLIERASEREEATPESYSLFMTTALY